MHIVLTDEQASVVRTAGEPVEVRDGQGRMVAQLTPLDAGDIEAIERYKRNRGKKKVPGIPSAQVQAFLQELHAIEEREGIDEKKVKEVLQRRRGGGPG